MKFFADTIVKPYIARQGYRRICEIGASYGDTTAALLELDAIAIDVVDPCLDADLAAKFRENPNVRVHKGTSLEVLPTLGGPFDCILIDGDHNWYTVYNELKTIEDRGLLAEGGTVFVHDVGWPYGRRDMYYQPDVIPAAYRHPHKQAGLVFGQSALSDDSPNNRILHNALQEGGPRNGVLTAIEDFLRERRGGYKFFRVEQEYGLGVLLKTRSVFGNLAFNQLRWRARWSRQ